MEIYRSPYEAYPFLCDAADDLRCDFELLTDEMASRTGLLRAQTLQLLQQPSLSADAPLSNASLPAELLWICELLYHMNPTLRTQLTVTEAEKCRLLAATQRLRDASGARCERFVLTQGCEAACTAHLLRVQSKNLVRLLYRHAQQGHSVPPLLLDLANLLSGYFFHLALRLNQLADVDEAAYESRNYPR
ncbi:MAG: ATP--cob(I)alamin adenosyltransferase [Ruthenibacterium sp.]